MYKRILYKPDFSFFFLTVYPTTIEQALAVHRRRRHRTTIYNRIKDELDLVCQDNNKNEEDVVLFLFYFFL